MARRTNAERRALAQARAGVVTPEVVEVVTKKVEADIKEAAPAPEVKKPTRTIKKRVAKVEETDAKNAEILGDDEALEDKTVAELRDIASDIDVEGRSSLTKKADLIDGIKSDDDWEK